jgi:hypothetical protein
VIQLCDFIHAPHKHESDDDDDDGGNYNNFRLLRGLNADVISALGSLLHADADSFPDVSEIHTVSVSRNNPENGSSIYLRNINCIIYIHTM